MLPFCTLIRIHRKWYNLLRRGLELRFLCVVMSRALFYFNIFNKGEER